MKKISIKNVSIDFNRKAIFDKINFEFESNRTYAIVGASGVGKTSLLNVISGLLLPNSGEVHTVNEISYQFQNPVLLKHLNILENCLLGIKLKDNIGKEHNMIDLLYKFGFDKSDFKKYPSELSGGMKQRVSIIQTLLVNAEFYLFDEPFNAIDGKSINIIMDYLWNKQRKDKTTFIMVTHNLEQAISICDEVVILKNDKTVSKVNFDDEFTYLNPSQRKSSVKFINYLAEIMNESN